MLETFISGTGLAPADTATSTIRVELFGERCDARTNAAPVEACPNDFCGGAPATRFAVPGIATVGTPESDVIVGTEGDDQILGGSGEDTICGFGGDDTILGNEGRDLLFGGAGNDQLLGGEDKSDDVLFGEDGQDRLIGGKGDDVLDGGPGIDRMVGGQGNDKMFVNRVALIISGVNSSRVGDALIGGSGSDTANYSQLPGPVRVDLGKNIQRGGDILDNIENVIGTPGNDTIRGDEGNNRLVGRDGNDRLDGRTLGRDRLIGVEVMIPVSSSTSSTSSKSLSNSLAVKE